MSTARAGHCLAAVGAKVYAAGGYDDSNIALASVEVLDTAAGGDWKWKPGPAMNYARAYFGLAAVGTKLYAAGGDAGQPLQSVEVLDTEAGGGWMAGPKLSIARGFLGLAAMDTKLYAVGGRANGETFWSVEVLDTVALPGVWVAGPNMSTARSVNGGVAVVGTKVYAVGGWTGINVLDSVEVLDTATGGGWETGPRLATARDAQGIAAHNTMLYVVGGGTTGGTHLASVEFLDTAGIGGWVEAPSLNQVRYDLSVAIVYGSSKMFAAGGEGNGSTRLSTVEVLTFGGSPAHHSSARGRRREARRLPPSRGAFRRPRVETSMRL